MVKFIATLLLHYSQTSTHVSRSKQYRVYRVYRALLLFLLILLYTYSGSRSTLDSQRVVYASAPDETFACATAAANIRLDIYNLIYPGFNGRTEILTTLFACNFRVGLQNISVFQPRFDIA